MMTAKSRVAWIILIFISSLFAFKYLPRYHEYGNLVAAAVTIFQAIIVFKARAVDKLLNRRLLFFVAIFCLLAATFVAIRYVDVQSLKVDRWSVIDAFLTEMFAGNYPYMGKSHMGSYPGPMPIYYVIALPFYLLGDLSVLSIVGYLLAAIYLLVKRKTLNTPAAIMLLLLTSFFLYWEVLVRSNIFTFSLIVLCGLVAFDKLPTFGKSGRYLTSIIVGLLLSTRSIFVLAYLIFFLTPLRNRKMKLAPWIRLTLVSALSFALTFAPLILLFPDEFREVNPFVIQSSVMMPGHLVTLFVVMALLVSLYVFNSTDKFFYSGFVLFLSILIYAMYHVIESGFQNAYSGSIVDISYFIFAVPFLLYFLLYEERVVGEYASSGVVPV